VERRALTEPIEDLGARIEEFRRQSGEIARMLDDLAYQLRAEVDKTSRWLRAEVQAWAEAEVPGLTEAVAEHAWTNHALRPSTLAERRVGRALRNASEAGARRGRKNSRVATDSSLNAGELWQSAPVAMA
jgi:hypothetical protein